VWIRGTPSGRGIVRSTTPFRSGSTCRGRALLQRRLAYGIDGGESACIGGVGATTPLLTRRNSNEERGRPIGAPRSRALTVPASVARLRKARPRARARLDRPGLELGDAERALVDGPTAFSSFGDPGWAKVRTDFRLEPERGGTRFSTQARVLATDARTRCVFGAYWVVVRIGSGLIRHDLLRAIARRAEADSTLGVRYSDARRTDVHQ
jgi:hypothetical protein